VLPHHNSGLLSTCWHLLPLSVRYESIAGGSPAPANNRRHRCCTSCCVTHTRYALFDSRTFLLIRARAAHACHAAFISLPHSPTGLSRRIETVTRTAHEHCPSQHTRFFFSFATSFRHDVAPRCVTRNIPTLPYLLPTPTVHHTHTPTCLPGDADVFAARPITRRTPRNDCVLCVCLP